MEPGRTRGTCTSSGQTGYQHCKGKKTQDSNPSEELSAAGTRRLWKPSFLQRRATRSMNHFPGRAPRPGVDGLTKTISIGFFLLFIFAESLFSLSLFCLIVLFLWFSLCFRERKGGTQRWVGGWTERWEGSGAEKKIKIFCTKYF